MKTLLVLVAVVLCFSVDAAADTRAGAWTAEIEANTVHMTIFGRAHTRDEGHFHGEVMSFDEPLSSFTGLSAADAQSNAANVDFELRRPAGTIAFSGRLSDGTAAGHYRFMPSDGFVKEMDALGYAGFTDEQMLRFAAQNFSPQVIRDLRAMGYQPTQREVEEIAMFHVTAELMREYARLGYVNLTLAEAVNLRIGNVDAKFIAEMRDLGLKDLPARKLADLAILGVRPSYIRELRSAGLTDLAPRELEDLRVGHITAARIDEYRKLGYANLTAHDLSEMGIMGVTPEYIRKLQALGYAMVPPDKLLKLKMSGLVR